MRLSDPQKDILHSRQQVNLFLAGQGSGKSHVAGIVSYELLSKFPAARGLIAANTYSQLTRSTMFRIRDVWKNTFGVIEYNEKSKKGHYVVGKKPPAHFDILYEYDAYSNIVSFSWGTVIYIGSLDNYKALDGMEIAWAILDETKDTREEAVKEVILGRLRQSAIWAHPDAVQLQNKEIPGSSVFNPLYIFTSPAKVPWINEWFKLEEFSEEIKRTIYTPPDYFVKEFDNKLVTISATHLNQDNLPENYIPNQEANLSRDLQNMLIYGDPFSKAGGEFYKGFDQRKQVVSGLWARHYSEDLPLHLTFDFNVSPYITLNVWIIKDKSAYQIDEFCLASPRNSSVQVCRTFAAKYGKHQGGAFIYGDPAGRARDTRTEMGGNDYTIIFKELARFKPKDRVASKAPPVVMRGNFVNAIFEQNISGIEIFIDDKCKHSIGDYLYLKEASDGTKAKIKELDENKVRFEKYGHTSDANDYFLCQAFSSEWFTFLKAGSGAGISVPHSGRTSKVF